MPLVTAAVCPHPPLLVPEIAVGAAAETADLRTACDTAVAALLAADPDTVLVVGAGSRTHRYGPPCRGDFGRWGADVTVGSGTPLGELSLLVGAWLLARQDVGSRPARFAAVDETASPGDCARLGAELVRGPRVAMLAMGDGSACHGPKAPGYEDPRADAYHRGVAKALAEADVDALLGLDPVVSAELMVAGRAAWQVLAGAAGAGLRGELLYDDVPYGVGYLVAAWSAA